MMRFVLITLFFLGAVHQGQAQNIYGASTRFDDSAREWIIYFSEEGEDSEEMGSLEPRWLLRNDVSEWVFRVGDIDGSVAQTRKPHPGHWTIRSGSELLEIRTIFPNDYNSWRITNNQYSIEIHTQDLLSREIWKMRSEQYGNLEIFTVVEGDKRDWEMTYQLDSKVTPLMMMAALFISIFSSLFAL